MRRGRRKRLPVVCAAAIAALVGGAGPSQGRIAESRTESKPYTGAQAVTVPGLAYVGSCDVGQDPGCVRFPLKSRDRYIEFEIVDAHGLPVYAVAFGPDGSEAGDFCGKTTAPIASPGGYIDVWLTNLSCYESVQPSAATTGEVIATFSRRR
jgi:hypothetical protein